MTRCIILILFSLVCVSSYGVGQNTVSCGGEISACPGEIVYFDLSGHITEGIKAFKVSGAGDVVNDVVMISEGIYSYRFGEFVWSSGTIVVEGINGNVCEIVYFYDSACRLKLSLPEFCQVPLEDKPEYCEVDYDHIKAYCLGDTVTGVFSSKNLDQAIHIRPEYIELIGGDVIHHTANSIDIVWKDLGLAYINFYDGISSNCGFVYVLPSVENNILLSGEHVSSIQACTDEIIQASMSASLKSPLWETSEGTTYNTPSVEFSFSTPGKHWIATVDNTNCSCTPPDTLFIDVIKGDFPGITCAGPICLGDSSTYFSEDLCSSYIWDISAEGTIVSGGDTDDYFVEVRWDSGVEGTVSLTTPGCYSNQCKSTTVEAIPIVNPIGVIKGPDTVCASALSTYSLEGNFSTQKLKWNLNQHGSIQSLRKDGNVNIEWFNFRGVLGKDILTARLSVEYDDCLLNCRGKAEKDIVILPSIRPWIKPELCLGQNIYASANNSIKMDWTLVSPSGKEIVQTNSYNIIHHTEEAGEYTLIMTSVNPLFCNGIDTATIQVHPVPDINYTLDIDSLLCQTYEHTYTAQNKENGEVIIWDIYDGDTLRKAESYEGHILKYRWQSNGPFRLDTKVKSAFGCEVLIERNDLFGKHMVFIKDTSCVWSTKTYRVEKQHPSSFVDWEIVPPSAGSIIELSDASVTVSWKDVDATLIGKGCNTVTNIDINLVDDPIHINLQDTVCYGKGYDLDINNSNLKRIQVITPFGKEISTSPNMTLYQGRYQVFCESTFGCNSYSEVEINERKKPNRYLSWGNNIRRFCETTITPFELSVAGGIDGDKYTWYHNNGLLPISTREIMVSKAGIYRVEIINTHGCSGDVLEIEFFNCCETVSVVNPNPPLILRQRHEDCYTKSFWVEPVKPGVTYSYDLGDGTFAQGDTVRHTYNKVGSYTIKVRSDENCVKIDTTLCGQKESILLCPQGRVLVGVNMVSDFSFIENCQGTKHELINKTTKINPTLQVDYVWDFGDPSSNMNTSTLENPFFVFEESKTYSVTLTATEPSGCVSTTTKEITPKAATKVDVSTAAQICLNAPLKFVDMGPEEPFEYIWDFGDGTSLTDPATHVSPTAHMYDTPGIYDVILTSINKNGCSYKDTASISVVTNTSSGIIKPDIANPVCPEDEVILSAPKGQSYSWNTGETTQDIAVSQSDDYKVVVTDDLGCVFTSPAYNIVKSHDRPLAIQGYTKGPNNTIIKHSDSLVICQGAFVELEVESILNYSYRWNNSATTNKLDYTAYLSALPLGRHVYSVKTSNNNTACKTPINPFVIHVVPSPQAPIISTQQSNPCSGKSHILSVQNEEPGVEYIWSNGEKGRSIETSQPGQYKVTARRTTSCHEESNTVNIYQVPTLASWYSGCFEACFPHQLCVDLDNIHTYELVKDGVSLMPVSNSASTVTLNEPGEYQLKISTADGCETTTKPLSLDAKPQNHSVSGIVYYDENENGIYDGNDQLLDSIPVYIHLGNTTIYDTLSNSGQYRFDTLGYTRLQISIDPSSSTLNLQGVTDAVLTFDSCIQNKQIDFPLTAMCRYIEEKVEYRVCPGDSVLYKGTYYYASNRDTFTFQTAELCDSLVVLKVIEAPESLLTYTTLGSCVDEANGSVDIKIDKGQIDKVFIDDNEVDISAPIEGLASGSYSIKSIDKEGCQTIYEFTIPEFQKPTITIETKPSCQEGNLGQLSIKSDLPTGMRYSLDGRDFIDKTIWKNLPPSDYTLYAQDANGCSQKVDFNIETIPSPVVTIDLMNTCFGTETGVVLITSESGDQLKYSLDKEGTFTTVEKFETLAEGEYFLYVFDGNGCMSSHPFEVNSHPPLSLFTETSNSCPEHASGQVLLKGKDLYWSLDRDGAYQDIDRIANLKEGSYTVYAIDANKCTDSVDFVIDIHDIDTIEIVTKNACDEHRLGSITIHGVDGMSYSLGGDSFSEEIKLVDYTPGKYSIFARDTNGCIHEALFDIELTERPKYKLVSKGTCENQMNGVIHIESQDSLHLSFNGLPYDTMRLHRNLAPDTYEVRFIVDACTYLDSVSVAQFELPDIRFHSTRSCVNSGTGTIELVKEHETDVIVFEGKDHPSKTIFKELTIGDYSIDVRNSNGCISTKKINIEALPELRIEIDSIPECLSSPYEITPRIIDSAGTVRYNWSSGNTGSTELARTDGTLSVQIEDECTVQDVQLNLNFEQKLTERDLPMPNIFSPNHDGVNDCFHTVLPSYITVEKYEQSIFDRLGNLVFISDDINHCWKGEYMGQPAKQGVYVHITKIWTRDCAGVHLIEKIGNLTVLR